MNGERHISQNCSGNTLFSTFKGSHDTRKESHDMTQYVWTVVTDREILETAPIREVQRYIHRDLHAEMREKDLQKTVANVPLKILESSQTEVSNGEKNPLIMQ